MIHNICFLWSELKLLEGDMVVAQGCVVDHPSGRLWGLKTVAEAFRNCYVI